MYTNNEIGRILHNATTLDEFINLQIEILENADEYLKQIPVQYFNFIGVYCIESVPRLIDETKVGMDELASFHFFSMLFYDFETFYKIGGAAYFKNSVCSIECKLNKKQGVQKQI